MAAFRFMASLFLLIAVVSLVADATPTGTEPAGFTATSLAGHWAALAPATLESVRAGVTHHAGGWLWDYALAPVLAIPTFLFFGVLGALCGYIGRRRHRVDIYVN